MRLILVRHGGTIENRQRILQGQTHGRLTAEGISQIEKLADFLTDFHIDVCFTSDLRRAIDTACIVTRKHPHVKIIEDTRLRERYLGKLQNRIIPANWNGTEPMSELYERVNSFLSDLKLNYVYKTVLIVSHGITLKVLLSICLGYGELQFKELDDLRNCSVYILEKTMPCLLFELLMRSDAPYLQ